MNQQYSYAYAYIRMPGQFVRSVGRRGQKENGSPCIVPAARGKKLFAAGRRQNIGAARKEEKKKRKEEKKRRGKEEKFAKKNLGGEPALDKKRRTPCGRSAAAKKKMAT